MVSTSETRIMAAALELLRTRGPRAVTIEAVSGHSGVARTTIYRRYADREAMMHAALERLAEPASSPTGGTGIERLRWVIVNATQILVAGIGFGGVAALITDSDHMFTEAFREVLAGHRRSLAQALDDGVADGCFRTGLDSETLVDGIVGVLVTEYARTGALSDDYEERLVALFLPVVESSGVSTRTVLRVDAEPGVPAERGWSGDRAVRDG